VTPGHGSPSIRRHALSAVTETFFLFSFSRVLCPTQHSIPLFLFVCCVCVISLRASATRVERHHTTRRMNEEDGWKPLVSLVRDDLD
jgi:hypothetical protein